MTSPEDRAELKRIQREWRRDIDDKLKQIEVDFGALGDTDLAIQVDNIRRELHIRLIPIKSMV